MWVTYIQRELPDRRVAADVVENDATVDRQAGKDVGVNLSIVSRALLTTNFMPFAPRRVISDPHGYEGGIIAECP